MGHARQAFDAEAGSYVRALVAASSRLFRGDRACAAHGYAVVASPNPLTEDPVVQDSGQSWAPRIERHLGVTGGFNGSTKGVQPCGHKSLGLLLS